MICLTVAEVRESVERMFLVAGWWGRSMRHVQLQQVAAGLV